MNDLGTAIWRGLFGSNTVFVNHGKPNGYSAATCFEGQRHDRVLVACDLSPVELPELDSFSGVVAVDAHASLRSSLANSGFRSIHLFAPIRRAGETRYLVPVENCRTILGATQLLASRLPIRWLRALQAIVSVRTAGPVLVASRNALPIERWIDVNIGATDLRFAISAGTPGAYRKCTIQAMSRQTGKTLVFVKWSRDGGARSMLGNEADQLTFLSSCPTISGQVPRLLARQENVDSSALLLSAGPSELASPRLSMRHIAFLRALSRADVKEMKYGLSSFRNALHMTFQETAPAIASPMQATIASILDRLDDELGPVVLPFGCAHRDFVPWNIRQMSKKRLFVFDWEFSRRHWLPLTDLFHFHVIPEILKHHSTFLWEQFSGAWLRLAPEFGIRADNVIHLYAAYLSDTTLFYLAARRLAPDVGDDRVPIELAQEMTRVLPLLQRVEGS